MIVVFLLKKPSHLSTTAECLDTGVGALNIEGCRVGTDGGTARDGRANQPNAAGWENMRGHKIQSINAGRWPPHLLLSHAAACGETCADGCPVAEMDAQSGVTTSQVGSPKSHGWRSSYVNGAKQGEGFGGSYGDTGGASRFFKKVKK